MTGEALSTGPAIGIVLVNWNGWRDTVECLESLLRSRYGRWFVVCVDNGSADGSTEQIRAYCSGEVQVESPFFPYDPATKPVSFERISASEAHARARAGPPPADRSVVVIENGGNLGFAKANNQGTRFALEVRRPEYCLFLNNDTVVDPDLLGAFVRAADRHPRGGFFGPKTYYYDHQGRRDVINFAGGRLDMVHGQTWHIGQNEVDEGQHDREREVDWVEGSCLFVRSALLEQIGLLDPSYFAYFEENDLVLRGRRAGYGAVYVPEARLWHKVSASSKRSPTKLYYLTRNQFWFVRRYATRGEYARFLAWFFGLRLWFLLGMYLIRYMSRPSAGAVLRGVRDGMGRIPVQSVE
ncbi:MAG TPA: glycosyltransferase family 2 protein [Methanoregulaceae archaeon]|nr:glycosyltransferase family 2 protein [Methanoregulaceae archaeon]